ncbi:MAG TPA: MarR family transcriptional regulator [Myxococcota bacterium]|nr:MarR family transcriptional regulator [Myxococcota bacterium]
MSPLPRPVSAARPEPDTVDVTAGIRLLARLARVAEQTCQSTGISLPQYRLLVSASGGSQRASELANAVGVSRPTLTSLVDGLEQVGLLRRVPVPTDRRGIRLELTDEGRAATARAERALAVRLLRLIDGDVHDVVQIVKGVVSGVSAALDREWRPARHSL